MPIVGRVISSFLTTYFFLFIVVLIFVYFIGWRFNWWFSILTSLILILIIQCVYSIGHGQSMVTTVYGGLLSFCPILIALRVRTLPSYQIKTLFKVTSIAVIITVVTTIIGLSTHQGASRILATIASSDDPRLIQFEWLNIGGFSFTYLLLTIYPVIIGFIREIYDKWWLKLLIIWLLGTYYLSAEYMTGLMGFIVISSLWFFPKDMSLKKLFILIVLFLIFFAVFNSLIANVLYDSASSSNSTILQDRFTYMADGLSGVENTSDVGLREDALMASVRVFFNSPLFGNWYKGGSVGGHSYILDFISLYGIVGIILIVKSYKVIFRQFYLKYKNTPSYKYALMSFLTAITLSVVNTGNHWLELTLIVPLFLSMIETIKTKRA